MQTTKGELRNITTGILHTEMKDIGFFISGYLGGGKFTTVEIGNAKDALMPILKTKLPAEYFTEAYVKDGLAEKVEIADLTADEKQKFHAAYKSLCTKTNNDIKDKAITVVEYKK